MRKISIALSVVMIVLMMVASIVTGDYYQYTDSDGTVRFTDDPSKIPSNQREDVQIHESVVSPPTSASPKPVSNSADESGGIIPVDIESYPDEIEASSPESNSKGNQAGIETEDLDAMRQQLIDSYKELESQKKALGPPPPESAKSGVKSDYVQKSKELNKKIEAYNQMSKEFDDMIKTFNSQFKQK